MAPEEPGDPPSLPGCGEFRPKHAHLEILVGSKQDGRSDQRWDFQVGLTYLCHLGKEAINEVSGKISKLIHMYCFQRSIITCYEEIIVDFVSPYIMQLK